MMPGSTHPAGRPCLSKFAEGEACDPPPHVVVLSRLTASNEITIIEAQLLLLIFPSHRFNMSKRSILLAVKEDIIVQESKYLLNKCL